jgi:hypothetical protein
MGPQAAGPSGSARVVTDGVKDEARAHVVPYRHHIIVDEVTLHHVARSQVEHDVCDEPKVDDDVDPEPSHKRSALGAH